MRISDLQFKMILHELTSIVGREHVITSEADLTSYAVDIYWVPRMLIDRGHLPPCVDGNWELDGQGVLGQQEDQERDHPHLLRGWASYAAMRPSAAMSSPC